MKILIVHQYYLFPGQPGGSRFNELARLWAAAGHSVTVIAGNQNYATGDIPDEFKRRSVVRTQDGAVTVWRCHVPVTYNNGTVGRMWAFAGFTVTSLLAGLRVSRPDVIITTSPPLTVATTGWLLSWRWFRRVKWIFEVRDLWPESAVSTGVLRAGSVLTRCLYMLERAAYRSAHLINVLTPAFKDDISRRHPSVESKIIVVPNGADLDTFQPGERNNKVRSEFGWNDRFVALYAGAHGRANAVQQLVDAASHLADRGDILIVTAGDGPERAECERRAREKGLRNIAFLGPIAKEQMPLLINAADAGIAVLQANPTFRTVYPNKVFDYMACARPTLLAIDGVARQLVCDQARAGLFATPEDGQDIADKIRWLADHAEACREMGDNGRTWVIANASREALASEYLRSMRRLISYR